jgi:hypothetical protein
MVSRTDIHRPINVQMQDPTIRHWWKDFHDHTDGVCDLEDYLRRGWTGPGPHCTREPWCPPCLCGCNGCTGRLYVRARRRKERREWRKDQRRLITTKDREDWRIPRKGAW